MAFHLGKLLLACKRALGDTYLADLLDALIRNLVGGVASVSFTVAAEDIYDGIVVSCQAKDVLGNDLEEVCAVTLVLVDDTAGAAINSDNYTIAAGTDGAISELSSDGVIFGLTESDGDLDIKLTIAGAASVYLLAIGATGRIIGTSAIVTHAA